VIYPTVLIFSTFDDPHVSAVIPRLSAASVPLVCDLSRFGLDFGASAKLSSSFSMTLQSKTGNRFSFEKLETVWWRRPEPFILNEKFTEPVARYVQQENLAFWGGALALLPQSIRWYNHFDANRRADRKLAQLPIASECGLDVPPTCVTSCPNDALDFIERHDKVVFKAFSGSQEIWRPTRIFTEEMRSHLFRLPTCPVIFQEYIEGDTDFRVTVIDSHVEAVAFNILESRYPFDVRMDTKTPCFAAKIPDSVAQSLVRFLERLDLRFGAFDLRKARDGRFVFFELNPAGQFLYLDRLAGTTLVNSMASALSSNNAQPYIGDPFGPHSTPKTADFEVDVPFALSTPPLNTHLL
jgi:glutathione synthase/RimK-type ligase-like ATP-grasp enzyme